MSELDELVRRTVDTVTMVATKAARFSSKILIGSAIVCGGGFLLGVAALSGGIEAVWIVLGVVVRHDRLRLAGNEHELGGDAWLA